MNRQDSPDIQGTSIHESLAAASLESAALQEPMKTFSVRLPQSIKEQAQTICERNATDLSTFFRQCAISLVEDYGYKSDQE